MNRASLLNEAVAPIEGTKKGKKVNIFRVFAVDIDCDKGYCNIWRI